MFRLPVRVSIKPGARRQVADLIRKAGARRVLLVSDPGLADTPWLHECASAIESVADCWIVDDIEPNPRSGTIDRVAGTAREHNTDLVVGLGGGSVLDAAKAIAMLLRNAGSITSYEGKNRFPGGSAPFIAIPTTCGTGSEVTWVSVVSVVEEKRKISIKGDAMFPLAALVDAELVATLPAPLVAATAMDAMTHAIEAIVGKPSNPVSDALAEHAIGLILTNIETAVHGAGSQAESARESLMTASTLAGIAFANADVGAVHCLSESIGGLLDHPHGLLNALLLEPVLRYEFPAIAPRLAHIERCLGGTADATALLDRIASLPERLGLPPVGALNIGPETHPEIAELAASNGSNASNQMEMAPADYLRILAAL